MYAIRSYYAVTRRLMPPIAMFATCTTFIVLFGHFHGYPWGFRNEAVCEIFYHPLQGVVFDSKLKTAIGGSDV